MKNKIQVFKNVFFGLLLQITTNLSAQVTFPVNGVHDGNHLYYAFINARIFVDYKTVVDSATLLIRDGKIEDAGRGIKIPDGGVVYDLKGKNIYPSLIDMYTDYGIPEIKNETTRNRRTDGPQMQTDKAGAYNWNQAIKPEINAKDLFVHDEKSAETLRKMGFGCVMTLSKDGIARGSSAIVTLGDGKENNQFVKDVAAANYSFNKGTSTQNYPSSLMGSIALIRQTYYDGQWYAKTNGAQEYNISLDAWNKLQSLPQIFEVHDKLSVLRADKIAKEFGTSYIIKGAGDEYQRLNEIKVTNSSLIIPLNFPPAYDVDDPYDALQVNLADMKHWELAPANPSSLQKAGINFAVTTSDLKDKADFWKNLRKAIDYGLSDTTALKSLTYTPAQLLKVSDKVGSLKKGMLANFLITSKSLFDKDNIIYDNWINGKRYQLNDFELKDIRGNYNLIIGNLPQMKLTVTNDLATPQLTLEEDSNMIKVNISRMGNQITIQFESKKSDHKGSIRLGGYLQNNNEGYWQGTGQLPNGEWVSWNALRVEPFKPAAKKDSAKVVLDLGDILYPNMAYGWKEYPKAENILIRNATVWTNEKDGILQNTDVLIQNGKIAQIGKNLNAGNAKVIDGTGKHLSPGIVDEHSHIAIQEGVNEGAAAVTSEVRIGDVVDCDDINIYRQLSGGVTTSHLLHGSANPIGGQTQLIKLRWGHSPEEMKFAGWDGFIKFALGENVKQSNWGDRVTVRFPQTRMGVEQVYMDAFTRAKEYEDKWNRFNLSKSSASMTPRKDIQLDALVEILNHKRFITCHSYVQSEINMLMHVADTFHFRVNTFTHILEGYKVADKMKKHGVGGSTFADWWAYKYEVEEAIPYNGAIMNKMGITVAMNSDDAEMARRLNQEAAKSVKYGKISEEEALKFVTINPAKLLHIDDKVGSIKVGKDADIVLWTDNPLSIYAKVQQTYVDGICYFDADRDKQMRDDINKERARLIQKMIAAKVKGDAPQKGGSVKKKLNRCEEDESLSNEE